MKIRSTQKKSHDKKGSRAKKLRWEKIAANSRRKTRYVCIGANPVRYHCKFVTSKTPQIHAMCVMSLSLSLVRHMVTDAKCGQTVFKVCKLTTSTKLSAHAITFYHLEIGYSGKCILISNERYLHFFQIHMKMSIVLKVTVVYNCDCDWILPYPLVLSLWMVVQVV